MPSSATTRNRLEKQAAGENSGSWGPKVNTALDIIDSALSGKVDISTYPITLTNADYVDDQAKKRVLNCSGAGGTITIPAAEKVYLVRNASSGTVTITCGGGTTATVATGTTNWVFCDGSAVYAQTQASSSVTSGSYTPTATNLNNVASATLSAVYYERISGSNMVRITGKAVINRSGSTAPFSFDVPLPSGLSSSFTNDGQAGGTGMTPDRASADCFFVVQSHTNGNLRFSGQAATSGALNYWFSAAYWII